MDQSFIEKICGSFPPNFIEPIIVVLGKGREEYQETKGKKVFYSDIQIIKEYK